MAQMVKTPSDDPRVTRVTLRLHASLENRPVAIALVSTLIEQVGGADRDFRNELITAFSEAYNNIVIHGYRDRPDGMLDVEAEIRPDQMALSLMDTGAEIDFACVAPPDLTSMPESGMGIFMIHALVDEVRYRGGDPNVLCLMKRTSALSQEVR
jgi:serine/threonine-protein kinase RsbW